MTKLLAVSYQHATWTSRYRSFAIGYQHPVAGIATCCWHS